ncbi:unnamed protein product, partial [Meganyctiphanes norvegica]
MAVAKMSNVTWQCDLKGPQQRLEYLFNTGSFSDITIKCPGGIMFELHRMVLAMCSPVFEAMVFGPLASSKDILCLDDDPVALKYVFAHCYGCSIQFDDIHVVLEVFKIADKYIFPELKDVCGLIVQNQTKPENFKTIYEFTVKYGYDDLKNKFLKQHNDNSRAGAVLMWFSLNYPTDLMTPAFTVNKIILDTWRNTKSDESFDGLFTILHSNCCNELQEFAGQVSGDILEYIPGPMRSPVTDIRDPSYAPVLKISLHTGNAEGVIIALHKRYNKYGYEDIGIHIANEDLPTIGKYLTQLPCYNCASDVEYPLGRVSLFFSDITNENLFLLNIILKGLDPDCDKRFDKGSDENHNFVSSYMFPRCNLKKEDFSIFGESMFLGDEFSFLPEICFWIHSPYIEKKDEEELYDFTTILHRGGYEMWEFFKAIKVCSNDNEIPGW